MRAAPVTGPRAARKALRILGTRGIPARHGGFETFAEELARHLVGRGWQVTVYCQEQGHGPLREGEWSGVRLVHCPVPGGALGTVLFDWKTTRHSAAAGDLVLTLGYNTAAFCGVYRLRGVTNLMNMDGLEWRRAKWSWPARAWLFVNERLGARLADHLVADHPEIERHVARQVGLEKITMIPYGAAHVTERDAGALASLQLHPRAYALVIARVEPENSILEIVRAFARRRRGCKLVLLGSLDPAGSAYHRAVLDAGSDEVMFPGAIYERSRVNALRFDARLYIHGHSVGGTNPSLVEALGAGSPVLAHDNVFNRWVAGPGAAFFRDADTCAGAFDELLDDEARLERMRQASCCRHAEQFTQERVLGAYEALLERWAGTEQAHTTAARA